MSVISLRNLTRDFKTARAVDGLSLDIQAGELFGLVGPDGAGKTTTLRLLAGLLDITGGEARVLDYDLKSQAEAVKKHIGYMAQRFSLYSELSVDENLAFFAEIYDVPREARPERTAHLLEFAGLTEFRERRAGQLSGGMQKKLALACTLIHQPEILLLDEPTTGVDPIARREFWNILTDLHLGGATIVVSTPYMDEADRCSRVGLMYAGKLAACAPPREIRRGLGAEVIELHPTDWQAARNLVASLEGVREVQTYGEALHILVEAGAGAKRLKEVERALKKHKLAYRSIRLAPPSMEEVFISTIRELREREEAHVP
ncbi:MAG TPA: ABC transporter ATP-binding protein [Chloroflexi bacterium]|nr:ABC transporter ATP-binding protein [Chloroflexota bacterium]